MLRKINLICVGTLKKEYIKSLEKKYLVNGINVICVKESNIELESKNIVSIINKQKNAYSVLFDIKGDCESLSIKQEASCFDIVNFIIGGSNGVGNSVKELVNKKIKLSDFTYNHQIFRICSILFIRKIFFNED